MYDTNPTKLRYVAKVVEPLQSYTNSTPNDVIYEDMDAFIYGDGSERSSLRASKIFLETSKLGLEEVKIAAILIDARNYRFIVDKSDGWIYTDKGDKIGRNMEDVLQHLISPLNDDILMYILNKVEQQWSV